MRCSLVILLFLSASTVAQKPKAADAIYVNGNIYTGVTGGRASEVAIRDGVIVAIGKKGTVAAHRGPATQVIDLRGAFVMPGFNDAHLHLANAGFEKLNVNLIGTRALAEMRARIAERVGSAAPGEWIVGRGWDHTKWEEKQTPTRQDLDPVTRDHPAVFTRVDGHIAVANTAALKAAGITGKTVPPQGGAIDLDENGEPTGILRETAQSLVWAKVPAPSRGQRRRAMELALADAAAHGLTSAQDNSGWEDFLVLEELQKEGKLTLRVSEWLPFDAPVEQLKKMRDHHPAGDPMLHTGMLKGFMDGSLGSRTAALLAPYADEHSNSGLLRYTQAQLDAMTAERVAAGFQIGFHAIGDRGTAMALHAFQAAGAGADPRFRIEHDQVIAPGQIALYRRLGVIASVQPSHLLTDMDWAESRLGPERAKSSYPWKPFLEAGVPVAFGTDHPVEPVSPFRGLYAAVTRRNEDGTKSYAGEAVTLEQAIAAYTTGAAYAEFAEKKKGTLTPGMFADLVVLDRDLTSIPPAEILKTRVLRTVVGGKTVYEAK
jgi:predicted amidohydrolase YtcJ